MLTLCFLLKEDQQSVRYKEYSQQNKANKLINYCLLQVSVFEPKRIKHLLFVIGLSESEETFSSVEISNPLVSMKSQQIHKCLFV